MYQLNLTTRSTTEDRIESNNTTTTTGSISNTIITATTTTPNNTSHNNINIMVISNTTMEQSELSTTRHNNHHHNNQQQQPSPHVIKKSPLIQPISNNLSTPSNQHQHVNPSIANTTPIPHPTVKTVDSTMTIDTQEKKIEHQQQPTASRIPTAIQATAKSTLHHHKNNETKPSVPPLPKVDIHCVPMVHVMDRLIQRSFSSLMDLSEEMVNSNSIEQKKKLLEYCFTFRSQFIKLLAILRWSKKSQDTFDFHRLSHFIQEKDMGYNIAADMLFKLHEDLKPAKEPVFDIPNAIDILSTGRYQQLPNIIKNSILPKTSKLSSEKLFQSYQDLHRFIRQRLRYEVIPSTFRNHVKLENGCVVFDAPFVHVKLILEGTDTTIPWKIEDLSFKLQNRTAALTGLPLDLNPHQLLRIRELAQKKLNQAKESENEFRQLFMEEMRLTGTNTDHSNTNNNEWMGGAGASLVELNDFLLQLFLKMKLKAIEAEAKYLSTTLFKHMKVVFDETVDSLFVSYWQEKSKLQQHSTFSYFKSGAKDIQITAEREANASFIDRMGKTSRKEMIAWSQVHPSECEIYKRRLMVSYFDHGVNETVSVPLDNNHSLETIMQTCMQKQALHALAMLKEQILHSPHNNHNRDSVDLAQSLGSLPLPIDPDEDLCLVVDEVDSSGFVSKNTQSTSSMFSSTSSSLLLKYHPDRILRISFDLNTGRFIMSTLKWSGTPAQLITEGKSGSDGGLNEFTGETLRECIASVNLNPYNITDVILKLRYEIFLSPLESMGLYLNLTSMRKLPLPPSFNLASVLGLGPNALDHVMYYQFKDQPTYFLMVVVCPQQLYIERLASSCSVLFMSWLIALRQPTDSAYHELVQCIPVTPSQINLSKRKTDSAGVVNLYVNIWEVFGLSELQSIERYARNLIVYIRFIAQVRNLVNINYEYFLKGVPESLIPGYLDIDEYRISEKNPILCITASELFKVLVSNKNKSSSSDRKRLKELFDMEQHVLQGTHTASNPILNYHFEHNNLAFGDLFFYLKFEQGGQIQVHAYIRLMDFPVVSYIQEKSRENAKNNHLNIKFSFDSKSKLLHLSIPFSLESVDLLLSRMQPILLIASFVVEDARLETPSVVTSSLSLTSCEVSLAPIPLKMLISVDDEKLQVNFNPDDPLKLKRDDVFINFARKVSDFVISRLLQNSFKKAFEFAVFAWRLYEWYNNLKDNATPSNMIFGFTFESATHFRLTISSEYALDIFCGSKLEWVSILDSSSIAGDKETTPWTRVPGFIESVADPIQPENPLYYSFVSRFKHNILQTSESQSELNGCFLTVPHGVFFTIKLLPFSLTLLAQHITTICVMMGLTQMAKSIEGIDRMMAEPSTLRVAYMGPFLICTIGLSPMGCLYLKLKLRSETQDQTDLPLSASDLQTFEALLNEKLRNLTLGQVNVDWLKFLLHLSLLPRIVLRDLVQLAFVEKNYSQNSTGLRLQWLTQMPVDINVSSSGTGTRTSTHVYAHLPRHDLPCNGIDLKRNRISLVFQFSDSKSSQLLPVRYNYSSGVLNLWKKEPDESDLTLVPGDSPFLRQILAEISSREALNQVMFIERVLIVASTNTIDVRRGGPGKLFPTLQHLTSRKVEELQISRL